MLAGLSLALGTTLTSAIEHSRAASGQISAVLAAVADASRLVAPLRLSNAELIGRHAVSYHELWFSLKVRLDGMADAPYSLAEPIRRTTALFERAAAAAAGPPAKLEAASGEIAIEAAAVWALWQRAEAALNNRLAIELAGPQEKWSAAAGLAFLGCLASGILFWSWWYAGERRRDLESAEARARENETRARALAESARELLLQCDPVTGRILRSNRKLAENSVTDLLTDAGIWQEFTGKIAQNGELPVSEVKVKTVGGQPFLAEMRARAVRDPGGNLARIDVAFLDVTAWDLTRQAGLKRIAELEQAREKLERQTRELLDQSFELAESRALAQQAGAARLDSVVRWGRNLAKPLEEAAALASRLDQEALPQQREATATLARTIDTVASSLHSLAEFVGIESSAARVESIAFSPRSLIEEVAEVWVEKAEAKGVEMPCFFGPGLPESVSGDLGRIRRALSQVTEHAVRYTGTGEVTLRVGLARQSGLALELRFEVEDSGAGFAPEELQALFEPFAPGLAVTEVASGLAIAKRLVESIGGQIGGESDRGQGTRIWMLVPVEGVPGAAIEGAATPGLRGKRALVVDDVASARGALVELAASIGATAASCDNGATALAQIQSAAAAGMPYDFVLADCEMPGLGGIQLAEAILDNQAGPPPSLILTIPYSQRRWSNESPMQGIRGLLAKPVRRQALLEILGDGAAAGAAAPRSESAATDELPPPALSLAPSVLIVEDNLVNQRVAVRLVEKMGLRASVVQNGLEAIQAVQRENYDLVLMDCQMPEVDGFSATEEIRRMEGGGSRVPIIAMTANAMRGDREKCLASGMDDYISKPVGFEDLRVLVTRWLARAEVAKL